LPSSRELVRIMLDTIIDTTDLDRSFLDIKPTRDSIALLVNNLGGLSAIEEGVVVKDAIEYLEEKQFQVKRVYLGHFMTSLNMPGASLTILKLPIEEGEKILKYLDEPVQVPGWQNRIVVDSSGLQEDLDEKVSRSRLSSNDNIEYTIGVDPSSFQRSVTRACQAVIKAEPEITKYDTIVGDGDCGSTLKNGATAILDAFDGHKINTKNIPEAIRQISDILENSMGGTSGAIYCIFLNALANGVLSTATKHPDSHSISIDAKCWAESLKATKVGDRTLMDALIPFVETFTKNASSDTVQALSSALNAAQQGAENTRTLKAKLGRASYISDERIKAASVPDPGAWGLVTILNGLLLD
ncbi:629_t:CDS:2, partial [Ambispora leptoticha]